MSRFALLCAALLCPPSAAVAQDAEENPFDAPAPFDDRSFDNVLAAAKQRYFDGEQGAALTLFEDLYRRLRAGETTSWTAAADALTYLGEIYYRLDRQLETESVFRWLLERDPETPISPYEHPVEVVSLFDTVRASVKAQEASIRPQIPAPRAGPAPLWTYAPFGIPQFKQRRPVAGALFGGLQIGLGVASIALARHIDFINVPASEHPLAWTPDQIRINVQGRRFFGQVPVTAAAYAMWGFSVLDAQGHRRRQAKLRIRVYPYGDKYTGLSVGGTF